MFLAPTSGATLSGSDNMPANNYAPSRNFTLLRNAARTYSSTRPRNFTRLRSFYPSCNVAHSYSFTPTPSRNSMHPFNPVPPLQP